MFLKKYDVHNMYDFVGDNEDEDREIKFPSEFVLQFNKTIEKVCVVQNKNLWTV
jgi:hypothetical protein